MSCFEGIQELEVYVVGVWCVHINYIEVGNLLQKTTFTPTESAICCKYRTRAALSEFECVSVCVR